MGAWGCELGDNSFGARAVFLLSIFKNKSQQMVQFFILTWKPGKVNDYLPICYSDDFFLMDMRTRADGSLKKSHQMIQFFYIVMEVLGGE